MGRAYRLVAAQHHVGIPALFGNDSQGRFFPGDPVFGLGVQHPGRTGSVKIQAELAVGRADPGFGSGKVVDLPVLVPALEEAVLRIPNHVPGIAGEIEDVLPGAVLDQDGPVARRLGRMEAPCQILGLLQQQVVEEELPAVAHAKVDAVGNERIHGRNLALFETNEKRVEP